MLSITMPFGMKLNYRKRKKPLYSDIIPSTDFLIKESRTGVDSKTNTYLSFPHRLSTLQLDVNFVQLNFQFELTIDDF